MYYDAMGDIIMETRMGLSYYNVYNLLFPTLPARSPLSFAERTLRLTDSTHPHTLY
jgi:hypothetical protein